MKPFKIALTLLLLALAGCGSPDDPMPDTTPAATYTCNTDTVNGGTITGIVDVSGYSQQAAGTAVTATGDASRYVVGATVALGSSPWTPTSTVTGPDADHKCQVNATVDYVANVVWDEQVGTDTVATSSKVTYAISFDSVFVATKVQ